jgi:hypothetical protein
MAPEALQHSAAPPSQARRALGVPGRAATHASALYARAFRVALRPIRGAEAEVQHLHAVEHEGDAAETPLIAVIGLIFFFLPIFLVMVGLALVASYVA